MKLLKESVFQYITGQANKNQQKDDQTVQIKIPSTVLSIDDFILLLNQLQNFYYLNNNIELTIKISKQLIEKWSLNNSFREIQNNWKDNKGNLTFYRNNLAASNSNKQQLLVLVGADLVEDVASLEHIRTCDYSEIFSTFMNHCFDKWIPIIYENLDYDLSIASEKFLFLICKFFHLKLLQLLEYIYF
jgi:hypothetical protein